MRQIIPLHLWNRDSTPLARTLRISEHPPPRPAPPPDVHLPSPGRAGSRAVSASSFLQGDLTPRGSRGPTHSLNLSALSQLASFQEHLLIPGSPILKTCNPFSLLPSVAKLPGKKPHSSSVQVSVYLSLLPPSLSPTWPRPHHSTKQLPPMSLVTSTSLNLMLVHR